MIQEVTKENFDQEVLQETEKLVLVDFWGPQCASCLALMPHVENFAAKYVDKLKIVKMNVVGNRMFCVKLQIMSLPTFIFYKQGQEIKRLTGGVTAKNLEKAIEEVLQNN